MNYFNGLRIRAVAMFITLSVVCSMAIGSKDASADWLRVPFVGSGTAADMYRPQLPDGVTKQSGHLVRILGKPAYYVIYINGGSDQVTLKPGMQWLSRAAVEKEIGEKVDFRHIEKLPPPPSIIREGWRSFFRRAYGIIGPAIAWATSASDDFNRTGADPIDGSWSSHGDFGFPNLLIASNKVRASTLASGEAQASYPRNSLPLGPLFGNSFSPGLTLDYIATDDTNRRPLGRSREAGAEQLTRAYRCLDNAEAQHSK